MRHRWLSLVVAVAAVMLIGMVAILTLGGSSTPSDSPGDLTAGKALYMANCAACHGADLGGTQHGPPFLNPIYAPDHHADEAFQRAVAGGVIPHHWNFGPMPPISGLDRAEVADIVAFVRSEQARHGIIP